MFQQSRPSASVTRISEGKKLNHFLPANDGIGLHYEFWLPKSTPMKRIMLCIPGYDSNTKYFKEFAMSMNAQGIGVYSFDLRGFGKSEGKASVSQSLKDIKLFVRFIKEMHPDLPFHLLGHSVGAVAYAMQYAIANPSEISSLVLIAPATKIKFKIWFNHLLRSLGIPLQFKVIDPEAGDIKINKDGKPVRYSPFHVFDIGFNCNFRSYARAPHIGVPTFIVMSDERQDVIIHADDILRFAKRVPNKAIMGYNGAGHLVFTSFSPKVSDVYEEQRLQVYADISKWINGQ
ncbi:alpha/beta fold hydrolase [Candidatus Micrarchaeota archaeon]|nr:alpha/beta fold hydrolase [Candidatus Micrarchaeota archaeon]